jgi:hypothetical protein
VVFRHCGVAWLLEVLSRWMSPLNADKVPYPAKAGSKVISNTFTNLT